MANYEINLTATQIEAALNKAHSPATTLEDTQNLAESGAIKTYVDTQVSAGSSITTASFAGSALEDSTEGLTATDTAIPTSGAVLNALTKVASLTTPDSDWIYIDTDLPFSELSDTDNIVSVDGDGVVTLNSAGLYLVNASGDLIVSTGTSNSYFNFTLKQGDRLLNHAKVSDSSDFTHFAVNDIIFGSEDQVIGVFLNEIGSAQVRYKNVQFNIIKLKDG